MNYVLRNLFDPSEVETVGQRVQSLLFELVVAARAVYELWSWTDIIPNQKQVLEPTGIGRFIDVSFMLWAPWPSRLNALVCAALLLLGITRRFSGAYALAFFSFALQYSARFCLGKQQHSTNMLGMALLALAISHLAFKREDLRRKAALGLTVALFTIGYGYAAWNKLHARGFSWARGKNLLLWIHEKRIDSISGGGSFRPNWLQKLAMQDMRFATTMLAFGLLSEMSALLMWWRPARRWVMLALAGMHIGISIVMNIHFKPSVLILLALALPVAEVVDYARARSRRASAPGEVVEPASAP